MATVKYVIDIVISETLDKCLDEMQKSGVNVQDETRKFLYLLTDVFYTGQRAGIEKIAKQLEVKL